MRPIYLILYAIHSYVLRVVFSRVVKVNPPKKYRQTSIIVSNHPSAFMDPLVIAGFQKPIVFFMTRSDVFKPALKPIFAAANMLPIYRQMDGAGAVKKNKEVFEECYKILATKRSPLLFGEGLTDDIFERKLKPIKKGAARLAFGAMEFYNWDLDLKIHCVGLNYEDPTKLRSKLLIANAPYINVNDYKQIYEENPTTAINQLTAAIENAIKEQITHINSEQNFAIHEQIMRLTFKGMHVIDSDKNLSLKQRYEYSKKLAKRINHLEIKQEDKLNDLKNDVASYFKNLAENNVKNSYVKEFSKKGKVSHLYNLAFLLFMWPIALIGVILMGLPYWITKSFIENTFKRKVFWLSTKMAVGMLVGGFFNIGIAILLYHTICPNFWLVLLFYFTVPATSFLIAYNYRKRWKDFIYKSKIDKNSISKLAHQRQDLLKKIESLFPETI